MTDEDLAAIEARALNVGRPLYRDGLMVMTEDVPKLAAEVRRLRGLVKRAEHASYDSAHGGLCPWCPTKGDDEHDADCPAFTPTGEVK